MPLPAVTDGPVLQIRRCCVKRLTCLSCAGSFHLQRFRPQAHARGGNAWECCARVLVEHQVCARHRIAYYIVVSCRIVIIIITAPSSLLVADCMGCEPPPLCCFILSQQRFLCGSHCGHNPTPHANSNPTLHTSLTQHLIAAISLFKLS